MHVRSVEAKRHAHSSEPRRLCHFVDPLQLIDVRFLRQSRPQGAACLFHAVSDRGVHHPRHRIDERGQVIRVVGQNKAVLAGGSSTRRLRSGRC